VNRPSEGTGVRDREISRTRSSKGELPSVWHYKSRDARPRGSEVARRL
jgi:hypothetical protein